MPKPFPANRYDSGSASIRPGMAQDKSVYTSTVLNHTEVLDWLSPFSPRDLQYHNVDPNDCFFNKGYVLDTDVFENWQVTDRYWYLWLFGRPSSGKTFLCSIIADALRNKSSSFVVLRLFREDFSFSNSLVTVEIDGQSKPLDCDLRFLLFGCIIRQILEQQQYPSVPLDLQNIFTDSEGLRSSRSADRIRGYLHKLLIAEQSLGRNIFLICDGIDRFPDEFQEELLMLSSQKVRIVVTSNSKIDAPQSERYCDYDEDGCEFRGSPLQIYWRCLTCKGSEEDEYSGVDVCQPCMIAKRHDQTHELVEPYSYQEVEITLSDITDMTEYVLWELQRPSFLDGELGQLFEKASQVRQTVADAIARKVEGDMQEAKNLVDLVYKKQSYKEVLQTSDHLEDWNLRHFRETIRDISQQFHSDITLAGSVLHLLSGVGDHAELSFDEVCDAVRFLGREPPESEHNITRHRVLDITMGTVNIDNTTEGTMRISRPTFGIYLREYNDDSISSLKVQMDDLCIDYLKNRIARPGDRRNMDADANFPLRMNPFAAYASQNWGHHIRDSGSETSKSRALQLLQDDRSLQRIIEAAWHSTEQPSPWDIPPGSNALHLCAWFGLDDMLAELRRAKPHLDINAGDPVYKQTPLILACRQGHNTTVALLVNDDNINTGHVSAGGHSTIFEAVRNGNVELVETLRPKLDRVAVNHKHQKHNDQSALHIAVRSASVNKHHHEIVDALLEHDDIDVNAADRQGRTPLMHAVTGSCQNTLEALLARDDINLECRDYRGCTAFHYASEFGNSSPNIKRKTIVALLESAEDRGLTDMINARDYTSGRTALMYIIQRASVPVGEQDSLHKTTKLLETMLDEYGADPCIQDTRGWSLIRHCVEDCPELLAFFAERGVSVDEPDKTGWTPLHEACRQGQTSAVEALLAANANIYAEDNEGTTPMDVACLPRREAVLALLQTKADKTRFRRQDSGFQPTIPLFRYIMDRDHSGFSKALENSTGLTMIDSPTGNSCLHWAVAQQETSMLIDLLATQKLDINGTNHHHQTPLHLAALNNDLPATKSLLSHDPPLNLEIEDAAKNTALMTACRYVDLVVALALVDVNAELEYLPWSDLQNLFFAAVVKGTVHAVTRLVVAGIDVFARDAKGRLALYMARDRADGGAEIMEVLKEAAKKIMGPIVEAVV